MDITTLAAANAYTDKKVAEGGGGVKVIDLTKYVLATGETFNDRVLALFTSGGGADIFTDNTSFWDDVDTTSRVKFVIDVSLLAPGSSIESDEKSRLMTNGALIFIETSFLVVISTGMTRVTILFSDNNNSTRIVLTTESLNIP